LSISSSFLEKTPWNLLYKGLLGNKSHSFITQIQRNKFPCLCQQLKPSLLSTFPFTDKGNMVLQLLKAETDNHIYGEFHYHNFKTLSGKASLLL
jgi:hypothetical protein